MKKNHPTIALAMIVKGTDDEAPLLARALASINGYVDAIYINLNHKADERISVKVRRIAEQYTDKVFTTVWQDNFVEARSFIFDKVPKKYDFIMWLDSDDTVEHPEKIKDVISIASSTISGIYVPYDYAHDEYGNVTVTHWVCRISRNDDAYTWQSSINDGGVAVHETLTSTRTVGKARNEEFRIVHNSSDARRVHSLQRNITLLEGMYERQAEAKNIDPRVMYYLATHYFDAGNTGTAEQLLVNYLEVSGWAEERSEAWLYLGLIFGLQGRNDAARQAFGHSLLENPKNPRPYVELGELEYKAKRYQMSEEWLLMGIHRELPDTAYVVLPMENKYRAYMLLAQTYINMGFSKLREAAEYVDKALQLRPTDPDAKAAQKLVESLQLVRKNTQSITRLARLFDKAGTPEKILPVLNELPRDMQDNPAVTMLRQKYQSPKRWPKQSIAIFCGNSAEDIWGPWGLDGDGMGGSEEAVIRLSNELVKLGWQVTVYATPGDKAGNYEGVEWKQYWEFNPKDRFDVLVAWRMPWFFDLKYKARKKYLWLHDVMDKAEFTKERLANLDKVIFVSKYHSDLYQGTIFAPKRMVSANGIDPEAFSKYDGKFKREPHRLLYMSSHVRGLEILYDIWPKVKTKYPDATLDVYYGWKTFDNANRDNPERMAWKEKMLRKAKELDGVTDRGRLGQDALTQEMFKANILAYPCIFPEVYNISTVKAIAAGMKPVTSDFAVLKDYKQWSSQTHYDPKATERSFAWLYYKLLIITMLKHTKVIYSLDKVREQFSWAKTAAGWHEEMQ